MGGILRAGQGWVMCGCYIMAEVPEGAQYYRQKRFDGSFKRAFTLPKDADPEKVHAVYIDGILHVAIQRREASRTRQIEVK